MDKWISNLKISYKLLVAPVLVLIFLAAFFIVGYWGLHTQKRALEDIYKQDFQLTIRANKDLQSITEVYGNIFQFITWANANFNQTRLNELSQVQLDILTSVLKSLKTSSDSSGIEENRKLYEKAFVEASQFQKAVVGVIDFASFDLTTATMAMSTVDEKYNPIIKTLGEIKSKSLERSRESFEKAESEYSQTVVVFFIFLLASISLSLYMTARINRIISKPIIELTQAANNVSSGNLNTYLSINSSDEIGQLASGFKIMVNNIKTSNELLIDEKKGIEQKIISAIQESEDQKNYLTDSVGTILEAMKSFEEGDLTVHLSSDKEDEIGKLFSGFNSAVNNIREAMISVVSAIEATASASNEISSSVEEMASGAREQSAQTTEVAGAVEQMTKTILETTKNASDAAEFSKAAGQTAVNGGNVVKETVNGMNQIADVVNNAALIVKGLGNNSNQIGEIVQVIEDIADQTNLLALNAAIEAARAGEQGRGFAVVADEVRKLAERTTKATKEIASMIRQIQKDTGNAVISIESGTKHVEAGKNLAQHAITSLDEIIKSTGKVIDSINQVASASEEQSSAAEEISKNIDSISNVSNESATGLQQIAHASEDLNNLTTNLQNLISKFNIGYGNVTRKNLGEKSLLRGK
jgi:methyl-accepting chemotaxis protein